MGIDLATWIYRPMRLPTALWASPLVLEEFSPIYTARIAVRHTLERWRERERQPDGESVCCVVLCCPLPLTHVLLISLPCSYLDMVQNRGSPHQWDSSVGKRLGWDAEHPGSTSGRWLYLWNSSLNQRDDNLAIRALYFYILTFSFMNLEMYFSGWDCLKAWLPASG